MYKKDLFSWSRFVIYILKNILSRYLNTNIQFFQVLAFVLAFCRWNSPQLFAVRIWCGYFLWVCFVYVLCMPFLCVNKSFFFVIKFLLIESRPFLYVNKIFFIYDNFFINSVSFCYCPGSYGLKSSGHVLTFNEKQTTSKYFESALV